MLIAVMFSIVISAENSKLLVMGPYRGIIVIPEAGKIALKTGKIIVIDMETNTEDDFTVNTIMNNRESRQCPGFVVGVTW